MKTHQDRLRGTGARHLLAGLAMIGLPLGCQMGSQEDDLAASESAAVTTIRIAGNVSAGSVGVAGVTVQLNGGSQATAVTDADGNFKFDVSSGSYSVSVSKAGATFSGNPQNLNNLTASKFITFGCTAGCAAPSDVLGDHELVITDPLVVGDARADSTQAPGGHWSFRFFMNQMAPAGHDENWFTIGWLESQLNPGGTVNNFTVDHRDTSLLNWPIQFGSLPWGSCPFHLRAIVNRTDLHATGAGELRFVFGTSGLMTVIFEYKLPATHTRKEWASLFHALSSMTPGSAAYNQALQNITDQVVTKGALAGGPNGGSAISQVRANEIQLSTSQSPNWQLREFHLVDGSILTLAPVAQTPDDSASVSGSGGNATLASFINGSAVNLRAGYATVPSGIIGGQSTESGSPWTQFNVTVDASARHAFAGQTCNGCHFSEINGQNTGGFYHVSPSGQLSPFITSVEIPRRAIFVKHLLNCTGSACATGAEPMVP